MTNQSNLPDPKVPHANLDFHQPSPGDDPYLSFHASKPRERAPGLNSQLFTGLVVEAVLCGIAYASYKESLPAIWVWFMLAVLNGIMVYATMKYRWKHFWLGAAVSGAVGIAIIIYTMLK